MENLDRRELIKRGAVAAAVTTACLCGLNACATYSKVSKTPAANPDSVTVEGGILTVDLSLEPELSVVGGAVKVLHPDIPEGVIIAHVDENRYEVVSLLCTHRGVELEYDHPQTRFRCPSLGASVFTLDGANVSGPAGRPLRPYDAVLEDGVVTIRL